MKISIIVPVYNVEKYLEECFRSIVAQTYRGPLECIFVDDCGRDGSVALLERLLADYRGPIEFHLLHHDHNKGLSGARNTGIRHATGQYLYFLDSDDTITPDCIEKLTKLAEKYKGVDMVQGNCESNNPCTIIHVSPAREYVDNKTWIQEAILSWKVPCTAWNKLVGTKFVLDNGLFFCEGKIHEDVLWGFFLAKHTRSIAFCYDSTYVYRDNMEGIMRTLKDEKKPYRIMLEEMARNISQPNAGLEVFTIMSRAHHFFGREEILAIFSLAPHCCTLINAYISQWHNMISTTRSTPRGFYSRIAYRVAFHLINIMYPRK